MFFLRLKMAVGIHSLEQILVLTDFGVHSGFGIHPVDGGTLDLAAVGGIAAAGLGILGGQNLDDVAVFVGVVAGAGDEVCTLQAALQAVGIQALVLGHGSGQEIGGLDPQVPGEGDLAGAVLGAAGVVLHDQLLGLTLGVVGDGELDGLQNRHDTLGSLIQILTQAEVQEGQGNGGLSEPS